jgi:sulfatase modifying factor 1
MTMAQESASEGVCCAPSRPRDAGPVTQARGDDVATGSADSAVLVDLPGSEFLMGYENGPYPGDGEGPVRKVRLDPFRISATTVSNAEFAAFVRATGHITTAEWFGWSFVFAGLLPHDHPPTRAMAAAPWWWQVHGATWRCPEGPGSDLDGRFDHPVVHVSRDDSLAFCRWAGVRLCTEAEWEYAARGGLEQQPYPWGNDLLPGGQHRMNVWQGRFPQHNSLEDCYYGTAPVDTFPPNGFGLYNMTGNVWEWCADWFSASYHQRGPRENPSGPPVGEAGVIRGGSYLCHASYCVRYRTSARTSATPDSSAGNIGFRCAGPVQSGSTKKKGN